MLPRVKLLNVSESRAPGKRAVPLPRPSGVRRAKQNDGAEIIAVHLQPNENAWLLGLVAVRGQQLLTQPVMGLVGARGFEPPTSSSRTMRATKLRHAPTEDALVQG